MTVCGIVLAAGAGTRFGGPKALARAADGTPWIDRAAQTLAAAGCTPVLIVLGAARDEAAPLVPPGAVIVDAVDWAGGLSASVRAALAAAAETDADAALMIPVDVPDLPASACLRVLEAADAAPVATAALAQATYDGAPGHPALIGRAHWPAVSAAVTGDRGAGPYLRAHGALEIECGDLWHGRDVDR
ncbi:MAG: hypothetical protein DI566_06570 [Microbacterium sp.]|nr:MAG: hypothetical protein DI566_06570 [Microbacterium sp.]